MSGDQDARCREAFEAWKTSLSQHRDALQELTKETADPLNVTIEHVRKAKAAVNFALSHVSSGGVADDEYRDCRDIYEDVLRCYLEGQRLRHDKASRTLAVSNTAIALAVGAFTFVQAAVAVKDCNAKEAEKAKGHVATAVASAPVSSGQALSFAPTPVVPAKPEPAPIDAGADR